MVLIMCFHPSILESFALPLGSTIWIPPLWLHFESIFQAPHSLFTAQACSLEFEILLIISAILFKPYSHSPQPSQLDRTPYIYACQRDAEDNMDVQLGQSWLHFLSIEYKAGCGGRGLRVKGMGCNSQPGKGPYSMHTFLTLIYEFNLLSGRGRRKGPRNAGPSWKRMKTSLKFNYIGSSQHLLQCSLNTDHRHIGTWKGELAHVCS